MFDKLIDFGCLFDWITPTLAALRDKAEGDNVTLFLPEGCGWSGREVARILKRRGIKSWGHMVVNNHYMLTINRRSLDWAQYLLDQEGVSYEVGR